MRGATPIAGRNPRFASRGRLVRACALVLVLLLPLGAASCRSAGSVASSPILPDAAVDLARAEIRSLAVSRDGRRVVVSSDDGAVCVVDAHTLRIDRELRAPVDGSDTSDAGAVGAHAHESDPEDGEDHDAHVTEDDVTANVTADPHGHARADDAPVVTRTWLARDGAGVAWLAETPGAGTWHVVDARDGRTARIESRVRATAFLDDGQVAVGDEDGRVACRGLVRGTWREIEPANGVAVVDLAPGPTTERSFVVARGAWRDLTVTAAGEPPWHVADVFALEATRDGTIVVAREHAEDDHWVAWRWRARAQESEITTWRSTTDPEAARAVLEVAVSPDGERLAVELADGRVEVHELGAEGTTTLVASRTLSGVVFDTSGRFMAGVDPEGEAFVLDARDGAVLERVSVPLPDAVSALAFTPDARTLFAGTVMGFLVRASVAP